jgi:D-glycero-D-manno-heptose 1,7-bisphosphate phosphatase
VFLDRDGVINRTWVRDGVPYPPMQLSEVEILPGVPEALALLADRGFKTIVVTNQPDVARGSQTQEGVDVINRDLSMRLRLDAVFVCMHDTGDGCGCRKPKPGMLLDAARTHDIDLARSFMVGDRWSDIVAGHAAGCLTFLVNAPYSQRERCAPDFEVGSLREAADKIVGLISESPEPSRTSQNLPEPP